MPFLKRTCNAAWQINLWQNNNNSNNNNNNSNKKNYHNTLNNYISNNNDSNDTSLSNNNIKKSADKEVLTWYKFVNSAKLFSEEKRAVLIGNDVRNVVVVDNVEITRNASRLAFENIPFVNKLAGTGEKKKEKYFMKNRVKNQKKFIHFNITNTNRRKLSSNNRQQQQQQYDGTATSNAGETETTKSLLRPQTLRSVVYGVNSVEIEKSTQNRTTKSRRNFSNRNVRNVRVKESASVKNIELATGSVHLKGRGNMSVHVDANSAATIFNSSHTNSDDVVAVVSPSLAVDSVAIRALQQINQQHTLLQASAVTSIPITTLLKASATTTVTTSTEAATAATGTTTRLDYILITDYDQLQPKTFWRKYGWILLIAAIITLCGVTVSIFIAVIHCALTAAVTTSAAVTTTAATRFASVALALPIALQPEEQTTLHAKPEHPVPMLSVQTAGCAGMERLGVPARTTLNNPPDERGQFSGRRMCVDARELQTVIRSNNHSNKISGSSNGSGGSNFNHHHYYHHHQPQLHHRPQSQHMLELASAESESGNSINGSDLCSTQRTHKSMNNSKVARGGIPTTNTACKDDNTSGRGGDLSPTTSSSTCGSAGSSVDSHSCDHHQHYQYQLQQRQTLRCPHHVPLPDSEWGQDRDLQIRSRYQQSEITRSYIKPPPNKTIKDVPAQSSHNFYATPSNTMAAAQQQYTSAHHHQLHQYQQHHHSVSPNQNHFASSYSSAPSSLPTTGTSSNQQQQQAQQAQQPKSKPSVITKLFSRKSSPKSPTALNTAPVSTTLASSVNSLGSLPSSVPTANALISCASSGSFLSSTSSVNSVSTSSSASSLSSAQSLPISTASAITTTPCNFGSSLSTPPINTNNILAGLGATTQLLTTIGVSTIATTSASPSSVLCTRTPPLSVSVPLTLQQHPQKLHQHQQQQQQILADNMAFHSARTGATAIALQAFKSNSYTLPSTSCSSTEIAVAKDANTNTFKSSYAIEQTSTPAQSIEKHRKQNNSLTASKEFHTTTEASTATGSNISRNSSNSSMSSYNCRYCSTAVTAGSGANCSHCHSSTSSHQQKENAGNQQHTL